MNKLDDLILQRSYELVCLRLLREIQGSGDCNTCAAKRDCTEVPRPGQLVRYNCYGYVEKEDKDV